MTSSSRSVSVSVRLDVGSSMMMTRASSDSALAISTICRCAIDRSSTGFARPEIDAEALQQRRDACAMQRRLVDQLQRSAPARLAADEDVGGDVEVLEQVELLVDEGDAGLRRAPSPSAPGTLDAVDQRSTRRSAPTTPPRIFISVDLPAPFSPIRPEHLAPAAARG